MDYHVVDFSNVINSYLNSKLCAILLGEKILLGSTDLLLFQCFFYPVICNDYETVLSLNSRQRRMSFAMRSRS